MSVTALVIVFMFFGIYGWLAAIEAGIALIRLLSSAKIAQRGTALFTPVWEITNVFLVLGFTGFAVFFNNALVSVSKAVLSSLVIGLVAILLRANLVLYLFYYGDENQRWLNILFALVSAAVPLSFGATGIWLITGKTIFQSGAAFSLFVALSLGFAALSVSFVYSQIRTRTWLLTSRFVNVIFCIFTALVVQTVINHSLAHIISITYICLILLVSFVVLWQAGLLFANKETRMWIYLSIVSISTPVLLALANRPYLAYPNISLASAFGAQAYTRMVIIGFILVGPFILVGLGLLTWLLVDRKTN